MEPLRTALKPLTDWLPPQARDRLPPEAWALLVLAVALLALFFTALLVRGVWRGLFARGGPGPARERDLREDLDACPLPTKLPEPRTLAVYHVPVRLRLVVVAPAGTEGDVDATTVEKLLDRVLPGLGAIALHDRPRIRVWPAQLSHHGFAALFHRCTPTATSEGEPSRWVLAAGRAQAGRQPVLLGLGLWADEPSTLGRLHLEPHQWLDVLRLRDAERGGR